MNAYATDLPGLCVLPPEGHRKSEAEAERQKAEERFSSCPKPLGRDLSWRLVELQDCYLLKAGVEIQPDKELREDPLFGLSPFVHTIGVIEREMEAFAAGDEKVMLWLQNTYRSMEVPKERRAAMAAALGMQKSSTLFEKGKGAFDVVRRWYRWSIASKLAGI